MIEKDTKAAAAQKTYLMEQGRLFACHLVLNHDAIARYMKLTASDMKCLSVINCYGAMMPGDLARYTGFTTGGITRILDHLESRHFIKRTAGTDRRTLLVEPLSADQSHSFEGRSFNFDTMATTITSQYSQKELAVILDFLEKGTEFLKDMSRDLQSKS